MDFCIFKMNSTILDAETGNRIRKQYIEKFIDQTKPDYQKYIATKHEFLDGFCYLGYLWDYLKNPTIVHQNRMAETTHLSNMVYVFWDIHSCERILIENYWKFDKNTVLEMSLQNLLDGYQYLPEDIYITDKKLSWTFVLTHEDIEGTRYCLKVKN